MFELDRNTERGYRQTKRIAWSRFGPALLMRWSRVRFPPGSPQQLVSLPETSRAFATNGGSGIYTGTPVFWVYRNKRLLASRSTGQLV